MKRTTILKLIILFVAAVSSCKKDETYAPSIIGKWNLVDDVSYLEGNALYSGQQSNYTGTATDYYDFKEDGSLYIKKNAELDTAKYTMPKNNEVQIVYYNAGNVSFGANGAIRGTYTITNLTGNTATLTLSELTPEGEEREVIHLKR